MAYSPKRSAAAASAACDALAALLDGGTIVIHAIGSGVPATCAVSITDQTVLATLTFDATAFGAASSGVATAAAITPDSDAAATGTASFFRGLAPGGACVIQGLCGTSGADLNLTTLSIVQHAAVSVTSFTLTESLG